MVSDCDSDQQQYGSYNIKINQISDFLCQFWFLGSEAQPAQTDEIQFIYFFKCHSRFLPYGFLRYLFGRPFFHFLSNSFAYPILQVVRRGSGALSPATHAHSTSHSQIYTTTDEIQLIGHNGK
jgi:hypothetical protein